MRLAEFLNDQTGIRTLVLREDGRAFVHTTENVRPILEANKLAQSLYEPVHERKVPMGLRHAATLPPTVVMQLNLRGIMQGPEVVRGEERRFLAFLDDHENRFLRTDNGRRLRNLPKRGVAP